MDLCIEKNLQDVELNYIWLSNVVTDVKCLIPNDQCLIPYVFVIQF